MSEMVDIIKTKPKLDSIKDDDFREVQDYFKDKSVENVRLGFHIRTEMVDKIQGNFKNKFRVKGTVSDGLICTECLQGEILTQSHCLSCPAWDGIREGLDVNRISDLVNFLRRLLQEKAKV